MAAASIGTSLFVLRILQDMEEAENDAITILTANDPCDTDMLMLRERHRIFADTVIKLKTAFRGFVNNGTGAAHDRERFVYCRARTGLLMLLPLSFGGYRSVYPCLSESTRKLTSHPSIRRLERQRQNYQDYMSNIRQPPIHRTQEASLFRSSGGIEWLNCEADVERTLRSAVLPGLSFRDFRFSKQASECANSIDSAVKAFSISASTIGLPPSTWTNQDPPPRSDLRHTLTEPESDRRSSLGSLATIAADLIQAFGLPSKGVDLGIILPNAIQIYWPRRRNGQHSMVYIQAYEHYQGTEASYRFYSVQKGADLWNDKRPQTVKFPDLPAELRNAIYYHIMDEERSTRLTHRQPAISQACRQVNKEFLALWFKERCKWLVCS